MRRSRNEIGPAGAEFLAGVPGKCAALAHLDLFEFFFFLRRRMSLNSPLLQNRAHK
jgi:hypothetical protein